MNSRDAWPYLRAIVWNAGDDFWRGVQGRATECVPTIESERRDEEQHNATYSSRRGDQLLLKPKSAN